MKVYGICLSSGKSKKKIEMDTFKVYQFERGGYYVRGESSKCPHTLNSIVSKENAIKFLMGQIMKETQGKANPQIVMEILKDKFGADLLWSPDGANAAVSFSDEKGGHKTQLALMNSQGGEFQTLMMATFATKCTWSADSKTLYCTLPGNIPDSAILPNDWLEGKISSADTFWKIDIASGKRDRLVDPEKIEGVYDALNPFLSKDEKSLFFVNKSDGKLYKLGL